MKVLNLYAGIGGNRKLWENVDVTAVENNPEIAKIYQDFFPNDKVIVADAHQYLLEHHKEFDFIWSSPPCQSHSVCNNFLHVQGKIRYPDMKLYEEIIFLKYRFKGGWVVENVKSYYEPLINPQEADRHYFWSNFNITNLKINRNFNIINARKSTRLKNQTHNKELQKFHGFDLSKYKGINKYNILNNCVNPKLGLHIFKCAFKEKQETLL